MEKFGKDMTEVKEDVSSIKSDITEIKESIKGLENQITGLTDLQTEHIEHHPKMRIRRRTVPEKIIEARYQLLGLTVTGVVSVIIAWIGIKGGV
jgi:predicted  nucleic acid-binding Zn-ribbon protein